MESSLSIAVGTGRKAEQGSAIHSDLPLTDLARETMQLKYGLRGNRDQKPEVACAKAGRASMPKCGKPRGGCPTKETAVTW